jgi:hypothetical protein
LSSTSSTARVPVAYPGDPPYVYGGYRKLSDE